MLGQKPLFSLQSFHLTGQPASRRSVSCKANQNGAGLNGSAHTLANQETVEMHIASTDSFDEYNHTNGNGLKRRHSVHVTPPRNEPPQQIEIHTGSQHLQEAAANKAEIKAVKAELSIVNAELRARDSELANSERHLRAREAEVALLRAALTGRDISLRNAKAEAAEAQTQIHDKDTELQNAFEQLLSNSKERNELRQRLQNIQHELGDTRDELENWTQKGFDLTRQSGRPGSIDSPEIDHDQLTKLLQNLSKLSKTIADDAFADDQELREYAS